MARVGLAHYSPTHVPLAIGSDGMNHLKIYTSFHALIWCDKRWILVNFTSQYDYKVNSFSHQSA